MILPPDCDQFIFDTVQRARREEPAIDPELEATTTAARMFFKDPRIADLLMKVHMTVFDEENGVGAVVLLAALLGVLQGAPSSARILAISTLANPGTPESTRALRSFCTTCDIELQPELAPGASTH